jgi:transcriptional regulator with XRE-family HTH domain
MDAVEEALVVRRVRAYLKAGQGRETRVCAGMSQSDVARVVGTDKEQVRRWQSGKHAPGHDSALKLARLYDELERLAADGGEART